MASIVKTWGFLIYLTLVTAAVLFIAHKKFTEPKLHRKTYSLGDQNRLPKCPLLPSGLIGRTPVTEGMTEADVEKNITNVRLGGRWWPKHCSPIWSVAIIVPYRDRESMMGPFLNNIHPILQRQLVNYTIYIVEQIPGKRFNKAKVFNVGFALALKYGPHDCYAFQDIDCLSEDDHNFYYCADQPRHLGSSVSRFNYTVFAQHIGCSCLMTEWQVRKVNGWSNRYYGWGAEDDDMYRRIRAEGMELWRFPKHSAAYTTLEHPQAAENPDRFELLKRSVRNYKKDGLSSLEFTLVNIEKKPLYTKYHVDV
ncbi:beta-1,4-N-acetylgalactosaminyltransferase bre-4-like [Penaeus monodon]|uniref:beta-1,4-N-acetylgalactosaminyltransferase bre-4-like n=1 Tax=Penaeus monodon TaxID=6687 RepID=UPI0018A7BE3C|nr:beta-1,4-N-acetylgalactosaminyltransferase bre-4-like [Penaeus monodon]